MSARGIWADPDLSDGRLTHGESARSRDATSMAIAAHSDRLPASFGWPAPYPQFARGAGVSWPRSISDWVGVNWRRTPTKLGGVSRSRSDRRAEAPRRAY